MLLADNEHGTCFASPHNYEAENTHFPLAAWCPAWDDQGRQLGCKRTPECLFLASLVARVGLLGEVGLPVYFGASFGGSGGDGTGRPRKL